MIYTKGEKIAFLLFKIFMVQIGIMVVSVIVGLLVMMFQGSESGMKILNWLLLYPVKILGCYVGIVAIGYSLYMLYKLKDM